MDEHERLHAMGVCTRNPSLSVSRGTSSSALPFTRDYRSWQLCVVRPHVSFRRDGALMDPQPNEPATWSRQAVIDWLDAEVHLLQNTRSSLCRCRRCSRNLSPSALL